MKFTIIIVLAIISGCSAAKFLFDDCNVAVGNNCGFTLTQATNFNICGDTAWHYHLNPISNRNKITFKRLSNSIHYTCGYTKVGGVVTLTHCDNPPATYKNDVQTILANCAIATGRKRRRN